MEKLSYLAVFVILFGVNILICTAFYATDEIDVTKAVSFYNSVPGLPWRASKNGFGKTIKISQIKSNLGWIPKRKKTSYKYNESSDNRNNEVDDLPENYDCRDVFPQCTTIRSIKDQSNCGSCWAVSTAAAFSDRLCIHSEGKIVVNVSAEHLLACDKESNGCNGGHLDTAWKYISDNGLVTGGDYGSNEGCLPYSISPKHSFFSPRPKTPKCRNINCPELFKAKNESITSIKPHEYHIRNEILNNGPITTGFVVYLSFQFYSSGIYQKLFIDWPLGGHAVRVIGWGEENGKKYWLVANSWGKKWGENGTFRIRRGTNECYFEENMIAGIPLDSE